MRCCRGSPSSTGSLRRHRDLLVPRSSGGFGGGRARVVRGARRRPGGQCPRPPTDLVVPVHTIEGITMVGGTDGIDTLSFAAGRPVRLRLINTDSVPHRISITGAPYTVTAVDGTDLNGPTPVTDRVLRLPAAGRYDVQFPCTGRTGVDRHRRRTGDRAVAGPGRTALRRRVRCSTTDRSRPAELRHAGGRTWDVRRAGRPGGDDGAGPASAVPGRDPCLRADRQRRGASARSPDHACGRGNCFV